MSKPNEERDIYYIPPNFLASGRLFGGMIRARNAIEACVLVLMTGIPIIKLPMSLTVRIIILCLLPLPLGIFGIIGFEGDLYKKTVSVRFLKYLRPQVKFEDIGKLRDQIQKDVAAALEIRGAV